VVSKSTCLFHRDGDLFVPTERTQGPWAMGFQFGGAPAALVAHVVEAIPTLVPLDVARLTVDLLRPVPIQPIEARAQVRREGKRVQVVDVSLFADNVEVVTARALRLRRGDLAGIELPGGASRVGPPAVPAYEHTSPLQANQVGTGMRGVLEYALTPGHQIFVDPTWVRLAIPLVDDDPLTPLERMAYVADSCSGFGHPFGQPITGINADLSLSVVRPCEGEWLCIEGTGWTSELGIGMSQVTLSDERGVVGGVSLSRLVDRQ
jgi:hypothetical protein